MFYKHSQMGDGHVGKCKECTKLDVTNHRNANIYKIRQYDRDRGKLPHRKKAAARYLKKFRKENPLSRSAHSMVERAIRDGRLKKPFKCSKCGEVKRLCAHHHDYYMPLDVVWLCQPCHKQLHRDLI